MSDINQNWLENVEEAVADSMAEFFGTMFDLDTEVAEQKAEGSGEAPRVASRVKITGAAECSLQLTTDPDTARRLAAGLLGFEVEEGDTELLHDAIGEVGNMVAGGMKTRMCESGDAVDCALPEVVVLVPGDDGEIQIGAEFDLAAGDIDIRVQLVLPGAQG